jgi:hypothetical protein
MKKILLVLLLPALCLGAQFNRNTAANGDMANAALWTEGSAPSAQGDTVIYDQSVCGTRIDTNKTNPLIISRLRFLNNYEGSIHLLGGLTIQPGLSGKYILNGDYQPYFTGAQAINYRFGANGITCTLSVRSSITGNINIAPNSYSNNTVCINKCINPSAPNTNIYASVASGKYKFLCIGDSMVGVSLYAGVNNATCVDTIEYGSMKFIFSLIDFVTRQTGNCYHNLQSAQFFASGNILMPSSANSLVNPGTSLFTLNGSGAQTITSNGKSFYDLTVNNSGSDIATPVSFADSATLTGDLTLTDGPVVMTDIGIKAVDYTYNSADSVRAGRLWLSGNYTRAAGASKCDTAGQRITFLTGSSHTMAAANKVYAKVTANAPLSINGGATITLLSYGIDGIPVSIASGTTLTTGSIAWIGGTADHPDTLRSGTPGSQATVTADSIAPAPYTFFRDLIFTKGLTAQAGCSFNKVSFGTYCNFTAPAASFSDTLHFIGSPAGDTARLWSAALGSGGAVPRLRIGLAAGKIWKPEDTVQCLTFTLDSGKAILNQTVGAHDVTINSTTDSAQVSKPIWISGDLTLAAGAKVKWLSGARFEFTEGTTHNIRTNGVKMPITKYRGTCNRL